MIVMDMLNDGPTPKRGDLVQTNVGDRRERTWLVLHSRRIKRLGPRPRFKIWAARWWELEIEMRHALYRSAERNGGQSVFSFARYRQKKKSTFENYMRRNAET